MQMGKKIDEESVGNWSANRKGHPKAQIAGKGRREGITQLLAPGKDGWRQYFNLVWVTGKWIFHRVRGASKLGGRNFLFTGTRGLNGQMCLRGRWGQGKGSTSLRLSALGLDSERPWLSQPSHILVACPWPS